MIKKDIFICEYMYFLVNTEKGVNNLRNLISQKNIPSDNLNIVHFKTNHWGNSLSLLANFLRSKGYKRTLLLLDDFFIDNFKNIYKLIQLAHNYDIIYVNGLFDISKVNFFFKGSYICSVKDNYQWGISLQPAIWDLKILYQYSKGYESPWPFERQIKNTIISKEKVIMAFPPPLKYFGQSIEKGKWFPIKKLLFAKYIINFKDRDVISFSDCIIKYLKDLRIRTYLLTKFVYKLIVFFLKIK